VANGKLKLGGTGLTNNETLLLDFESVADTIGLSSDSGVTKLSMPTFDITALSFTIGANTLTTSEFANLDGIDQTVAKSSNIQSYNRDAIRYSLLLS
jgi:hypothetical protein